MTIDGSSPPDSDASPGKNDDDAFEIGENESLTEAAVRVVSSVLDVETRELEPLYPILDPDALDSLYESDERAVEISFTYSGCDIVAFDDGTMRVTPN